MDPDSIRYARGCLPPDTIYADWAACALPLPIPRPKFLPPAHTLSHPSLLAARHALHTFLNDTQHAYHIIFTSGATAAFQLLAHRLPWSPAATLITHTNVHNAVLGIRNPALAAGATFRSVSSAQLQDALSTPAAPASTALQVSDDTAAATKTRDCCSSPPSFTVLAYPAECNLTGTVYPLSWCSLAKRHGLLSCRPDRLITLVDTAKFLTTSAIDLDAHASIDALVFSSYKLCGSHTGLGALVMRKGSLLEELLQVTAERSYFGGGRGVQVVTPFSGRLFVATKDVERGLEVGTPNLQAIETLAGILERFSPTGVVMAAVKQRASEVGGAFRKALKEAFGEERVALYGEREEGCVVAFTLFREGIKGGRKGVGHTEVGRILEMGGVYARVGCMCNAGGCASGLGLSDADVVWNYERGVRCGEGGDLVGGRATGVVRVSFGWGSLREDAVGIVRVLREFVCVRIGGGVGIGGGERGRVNEVWVYGVKGCGGSMVERGTIGATGGVVGDRVFGVEWMGRIVSVREVQGLAGVRARWEEGGRVALWSEGDETGVVHVGEAGVTEWMKKVVGVRAEVVRLGKASEDMLVVWEGELREVGRECEMRREDVIRAVRPNVVIEGAVDEKGRSGVTLRCGDARLVKKRECTRCGVVNAIAGWRSGTRKGEPLRSIARVNRRRGTGGLIFGTLYRGEDAGGEIAVGDVVLRDDGDGA